MGSVVVVIEPFDDHPLVHALSDRYDIDAAGALDVYRGVLMDLCTAAAGSNGDLVLAAPDEVGAGIDPRDLLVDAVDSTDELVVEYDPTRELPAQVTDDGSGALTLLFPRSPFLRRTHLDSAAMRLRRHDAVLGPTAEGGVCSVSVADADRLAVSPADLDAQTLVRAVVEHGGTVDFLAPWPTMTSPHGVAGTRALLAAYEAAGREVAPFTRAALTSLDPVSSADPRAQ